MLRHDPHERIHVSPRALQVATAGSDHCVPASDDSCDGGPPEHCASRIADALVTQYIRGQPFHLRLRVAVIAFTTLASFFGLAIGALSISRHLNLPQPRPTYTAPCTTASCTASCAWW